MKNILKIFHEKSQDKLVQANSWLLAFIVLLLVVVAFLPSSIQDTLNKILTTTIYFTAILSLAYRSFLLFPAAILLTVVQWASKILGNDNLEMVAGFLNTIFFTFITIKLVKQFAVAKEVSPLVILGSINGYLLLGLVFSIFTILVSGVYPESYCFSSGSAFLNDKTNFHIYIYYTFITMATVGYGDIVPQSSAARALAVLISVAGQLYVTVVIAFLVGKFAGFQRQKDKETG